jgi:hypothetical protein
MDRSVSASSSAGRKAKPKEFHSVLSIDGTELHDPKIRTRRNINREITATRLAYYLCFFSNDDTYYERKTLLGNLTLLLRLFLPTSIA